MYTWQTHTETHTFMEQSMLKSIIFLPLLAHKFIFKFTMFSDFFVVAELRADSNCCSNTSMVHIVQPIVKVDSSFLLCFSFPFANGLSPKISFSFGMRF